MKPLPSSLELPVEGSGCIGGTNNTTFSKDHILVNYNWDESTDELSAELVIVEYPPHVRNLLAQTVTHEEIRIYSGARVENDNSVRVQYPGSSSLSPLRLNIKSSKRPNIERAITWIRRLLDQAMNLPKFKEKVLIGLENASPGFDVRGKVLGPAGANLQYITNETGAIVTLRGRGSGFIEPTTGLESIEPLHLCVEHNSKYEVLQAGRQLAFNLIETVQQEWYTYQQQHVTPQQAPNAPVSHHGGTICSSTSTTQLVNIPPPTTTVPPMLTTSVPPPLIHQPPPQPNPLQLAANLNQLVQGPPPHLQPNQLSQPPPVHQPNQLVQQAHQQNQLVQQAHQQNQLVQQSQQPQPGQLVQTNHTQQNPLVQQSQQTTQLVQQSHQLVQPSQVIHASQLVQASQQSQIVDQNQAGHQAGIINQQSLSLVQQGQPSALLQAQQALSQAMVVPGSGGGVQVLQAQGPGGPAGVQVLQTGQLSAATALQPQQTLQEIPHVYSAAASGAGAAAANVLTQQVLAPQASIIAQQPHIISQASYPLQYMQSAGGGSMALLYGATPGGNTASRDGVMVVQYGGTAARSRIQPQIVQLVHPTTGQVMGAAPLLLQAPPSPLLLQQPTAPPGLLLQQQATAPAPSSVLLPQHQLQFAQHQPVQIVPQPPPQALMTVNTSSGQHSVVTSSVGVAVSSPGLRPVQGQKRRFEQDNNAQGFNSAAVSVSEVSSPQHNKKGIGDESQSPNKMAREQLHQPPSSQPSNTKLMLTASQSDESEQHHTARIEIKPDPAKRGRTSHGETDIDGNKESKTIYSYGSGKILTTYQHQAIPCVQQAPSIAHQVMPPQLQVTAQQGVAPPQGVNLPQGVSAAQGVAGPQGVVPPQGMPGPPQFSAPPPHYPPQYYQTPPYQTYQPTWSHMHNPNNQ